MGKEWQLNRGRSKCPETANLFVLAVRSPFLAVSRNVRFRTFLNDWSLNFWGSKKNAVSYRQPLTLTDSHPKKNDSGIGLWWWERGDKARPPWARHNSGLGACKHQLVYASEFSGCGRYLLACLVHVLGNFVSRHHLYKFGEKMTQI